MPSKTSLTLPKLTAKAQKIFNAWVRNRDKELGCISCGGEVQHAGHYLSAGHHTALRFDECNVNGQCLRCNNFLHGNLIRYRQGLVAKYGKDKVNLLENYGSRVKKWSRLELEWICQNYKQ